MDDLRISCQDVARDGMPGSLHITNKQEQYSLCFISTVATVAGYKVARLNVDDDSIDLGIAGNRKDGARFRHAPHLDVQAKCTTQDDGKGAALKFKLSRKNYDDLRDPHVHVPRILVVVCVPKTGWTSHGPQHLLLRRSAVWYSLRGLPAKAQQTVTVSIPRTNIFNAETLDQIMKRIGEGGQS